MTAAAATATAQPSSSESSQSDRTPDMQAAAPSTPLSDASGRSEERLTRALSSAQLSDDSDAMVESCRMPGSPIKRRRSHPFEGASSSETRIAHALSSHDDCFQTPRAPRRPINSAADAPLPALFDCPAHWPVQLGCGRTRRRAPHAGRTALQLRAIRRRVRPKSPRSVPDLQPRRLDFDHMDECVDRHDPLCRDAESGRHASKSSPDCTLLQNRPVASHDLEASVNDMLESMYAAQRDKFRQRWNFDVVHGPQPGPWIWESLSE